MEKFIVIRRPYPLASLRWPLLSRELTCQTLPHHHIDVKPGRLDALFAITFFSQLSHFFLSLSPTIHINLCLLFSLFSNWDDKISDCHSSGSLLLIDKTISNPSRACDTSDALVSQSVNRAWIYLSFWTLNHSVRIYLWTFLVRKRGEWTSRSISKSHILSCQILCFKTPVLNPQTLLYIDEKKKNILTHYDTTANNLRDKKSAWCVFHFQAALDCSCLFMALSVGRLLDSNTRSGFLTIALTMESMKHFTYKGPVCINVWIKN